MNAGLGVFHTFDVIAEVAYTIAISLLKCIQGFVDRSNPAKWTVYYNKK